MPINQCGPIKTKNPNENSVECSARSPDKCLTSGDGSHMRMLGESGPFGSLEVWNLKNRHKNAKMCCPA